MRVVSWNVLADPYFLSGEHGDYSYVDATLRKPGARLKRVLEIIERWNQKGVGIVALQEADWQLAEALDGIGHWQTFWSAQQGNQEGRLLLINQLLRVTGRYQWLPANAQMVTVNNTSFVNAQLTWAPAHTPNHPGVDQLNAILQLLGPGPAVILADTNDRPGGPVRRRLAEAGFTNTDTTEPTAFVKVSSWSAEEAGNQAMDLIAARTTSVEGFGVEYETDGIPSRECPSDHAPVSAKLIW